MQGHGGLVSFLKSHLAAQDAHGAVHYAKILDRVGLASVGLIVDVVSRAVSQSVTLATPCRPSLAFDDYIVCVLLLQSCFRVGRTGERVLWPCILGVETATSDPTLQLAVVLQWTLIHLDCF